MQQNKTKKSHLKIIFVIAILAVLITIVIVNFDIKEIIESIKTVHLGYFFIALFMAFAYFIVFCISNQITLRTFDKKLPYIDGFLIHSTEFFINGITPFNSGSQPFQAYMFVKRGVDASNVTSVLVMNFFIYQVLTNIIATLTLIFYFNTLTTTLMGSIYIILVGYIINLLILIILLALCFSKKIYKVIRGFINFFKRIKKLEKKATILSNKTEGFVTDFQNGIKLLLKRKLTFLLIILTKLISLILFYAITVLLIFAFRINLTLEQIIYTIGITCFALTVMIWVPLPGASGGTEWAFAQLIVTLSIAPLTQPVALAVMLLWRFLTYYLGLIYGGICNIIVNVRRKKEADLLGENK